MNNLDENYHLYFIQEIRRRLVGECQERVLKCLDLLSEDEIWFRPNDHSNSVGNLILHLRGNVEQWLFSTLGKMDDTRKRKVEFSTQGGYSRDDLKHMIVVLMRETDRILKNVHPTDLTQAYRVQGFEESGIAILIHITEHFSYHVGQITYFVKAHRNLDTGYYEGQDLDQTV